MKNFFLIPILLILLGCPSPEDQHDDLPLTIHIEREENWTNTITLSMWVAHSSDPWHFSLLQNDSIILEGKVLSSDTTISVYGLTHSSNYSFSAQLMADGVVLDISDTLLLRTKSKLESLGLEGHFARRMILSDDRLFVGIDVLGVNQLNISSDSSGWQYLGLSNSELSTTYRISDILINPENSQEILVAGKIGSNPTIYRSVDGGASWNLSGGYGPDHPNLDKFQFSIGRVIGWGTGRQYISYDFGYTWINQLIPWPLIPGLERVSAFEKCAFNDDYLWFSGYDWYDSPGLFRSQNGGEEWERMAHLDEYGLGGIYTIAPHPLNRNIVYVVLAGHLLKCIDGGDNWVANGLDDSEALIDSVGPVHIDSQFPDRMFISRFAEEKLQISIDAGLTWNPMGVSLPPGTYVGQMVFESESSRLYLGTNSGVYLVRIDKFAQF